jgi:hypothetical protein
MDEKLRILTMLEEGKISAEEANNLLEAIGDKSEKIRGKSKWLKIKVLENGTQKVNVKIPLKVVKIAAKIGGKLNVKLPEEAKEHLAEKGINLENIKDMEELNQILAEIEKEAPFELVNVEEGTKKVYVYIE